MGRTCLRSPLRGQVAATLDGFRADRSPSRERHRRRANLAPPPTQTGVRMTTALAFTLVTLSPGSGEAVVDTSALTSIAFRPAVSSPDSVSKNMLYETGAGLKPGNGTVNSAAKTL